MCCRFIAQKYNLIFNDLNLIKDWSNQIHHPWLNTDSEEDIRISSMISEIVHHRDSFHPFLFEHHECTVDDQQVGHVNQVGHLSKTPLNLLEIHELGPVDASDSKQQNYDQI